MNKKARRLGLIVIALTLLAGCTGADSELDSMKDTCTIEESNTSEVAHSSEETNTVEKTNSLEESYELRYGLHDVEVTQDYGVFQVDNSTPFQELITKTVDIHKFAQYFNPSGGDGRGIDEVMEFIGVECLRETEKALYSVHEVEQGGLLYIFYSKEPWRTEITTNRIIKWYYVRERLSLSDFAYLEENVTTIEEAIQFNEVEQIYLNCYNADPMFMYEPTFLIVSNYLEDCLLDIKYDLVDGEFVFSEYGYSESYDLACNTGGRGYPYEARILDMDWVE